MIPHTQGLFKAIQVFVEMTNMVQLGGINKTGRLLAIDGLVKSVVEKSIFDVELVYWPGARSGNGKDNADGGWFDDRTESFIKINSSLLGVTANNPTCFMASKRAIRVEFVFKNIPAKDDIGTRWARDK